MTDHLVFKAREFAREAHRSQLRKYTGEPYFVHLEEVAGLVERAGLSNDAVAAAWLHDEVPLRNDSPTRVTTRSLWFGLRFSYSADRTSATLALSGVRKCCRQGIFRRRACLIRATQLGPSASSIS